MEGKDQTAFAVGTIPQCDGAADEGKMSLDTAQLNNQQGHGRSRMSSRCSPHGIQAWNGGQ